MISFTTIFGSNLNSSFGQISLVPDNSLIAQTTDCITSMMTSALIGINSDCTDNINKINSTSPDSTTSISSNKSPDSTTSISSNKSPDSTTSISSNKSPDSTTSISSNSNPYNLSKNNPFYHEFQTTSSVSHDKDMTTFTPGSTPSISNNNINNLKSPAQDNPSTFIKSPAQDNPSTLSIYRQQNINQPISSPYSFQSSYTTINKNTLPTSNHNELKDALDGKNKHSKEISDCFDRAFSTDNYLSDSEIIECAKDRNSFSQSSINSYALSEKIVNNDKNSDGKTDNKHSKEISDCFDRAFSTDNYLSDSEIIECAKDRNSFK
ncbi:MAG: hypothetical protein R2685_01695 [Candidatus Nitrosocosmicus sp.]|nr:hypothetical protein [Candidatus Nitrosocosmicus sp.]